MSYILDALKRSEQERHQEKVAAIGNDMMVMPRHSKQQPIWPYLLLIALLINAGVFIYFSMTESETTDTTSTTSGQEHDLKSAVKYSENDTPLATQTQTKPRTKEIPAHLRKPIQAPKKISDLSPVTSAPNNQTAFEAAPREMTPQGEEIIRPKQGVERVKPTPSAEVLTSSLSEQDDSTAFQTQQPVIPPDNEATPFQDIPLLSEMSLGFQRQIPSIQFSSHIYSSEPSARRAMINNLYLREGDGFSGLVLQEIGEFYVVLEKQGDVFRIPVLRDWQSP